jgi:hypothetical protein
MMLKRTFFTYSYIFLVFFIFSLSSGYGQKLTEGYFGSPLAVPLSLSASFGEIRPNHFHAGIDIRTQQREGLPILAMADGYISRIRIQSYGYGKMLYVNHPNGYTTFFAHLLGYAPAIEKYLKENQYKQETFEIDLLPDKDMFKVKKGDTIAFSGNTGSSAGPHIHFEIRETKSDWIVNPMLAGFDIPDNIAPSIKKIRFYPLEPTTVFEVVSAGKKGTVTKTHSEPFDVGVTSANGKCNLTGIKSIKVNGTFGVGISTSDRMSNTGFRFGVYSITLKTWKEVIFKSTLETMNFYDIRYVNAHIDYEVALEGKGEYQRMFLLPNNHLPIYQVNNNRGRIKLKPNDSMYLTVEVADFHKNATSLVFKVGYLNKVPTPAKPVAKVKSDSNQYKKIPYDRPSFFKTKDIELYFMQNSFYDTVNMLYRKMPKVPKTYSDRHIIGSYKIPVHDYYTIKIRANALPEHLRSKAVIASVGAKGHLASYDGVYKDEFVESKIRNFGAFAIAVDTIAPVITPLNIKEKSQLANVKSIRVKISDDFSGIASFRGTIDGKWILMEYDKKYKLLVYTFDETITTGLHNFCLEVTDNKNNVKNICLNFYK